MGFSSNTLLHQTSKGGLLGILNEQNFRLSYSLELVSGSEMSSFLYFPMVCFSDIPFSSISCYLGQYDDYTIGIKKSWAKENRLNPVTYLESNSRVSEYLIQKLNYFNGQTWKLSGDKEKDANFVFFLYSLASSKNYEGGLETKKLSYDNYRFSDEREWRYIPDVYELGLDDFALPYLTFKGNEEKYKEKAFALTLSFNLENINYIIVNSEHEIEEIRKLFSDKGIEQVNIFTNNQIRSDFIGGDNRGLKLK